jgi:fermentation-respiration switch protein FrsA (DUF1100 family)
MIALPTDAELVDAAAATYAPTAPPYFEDAGNAIRVFLSTREDGLNILAVEGTHDVLGWALDFVAADIDDQQGMNHATLGFIHAGFYASAVAALTRCALLAGKGPYAICGHSLGAALALLIGGLLSDDNLPPVKIGAFAPPRVGGPTFAKVVTRGPFCAYRFNLDPVTEVPLTITPLFPYIQVPLVQIPGPSIPLFDLKDRIACHHITNYVVGVHKSFGT